MVAPALKQTWAVMGVLLNMVGQGMVLSFPSILLPAIQAPHSEIQADLHVASWVASCIAISSIPALLISSFLMDWCGRKKAHIIVIIPGTIGWILIFFSSNNNTMLIIGRVLCGFTAGSTLALGAVVIGEYTSPSNRGMFLNLKTTAVCLGNMSVHIFGHFLVWKHVALVALVPHIAALLIISTWPESPAWLASKKRYKSSEKSFNWLRGTSPESRREIDELIRAQKASLTDAKSTSILEKIGEFFNKFTRRDFVKPLIVMVFCGVLLEACGRHIFPAYALQIIGEVTGSTQSFYYTLAIDLIISASALFSSALVKVLKRRTLLFSSGFAALFVLACVCLYLYLTANGIMSKDRPWIPILLFAVYFILSNLGCTPIPLALLGELFPLAHRGVGSALSGIIFSLFLMVGMQVTPFLLVSVKVYGTFAVFGSAMGLALVVLCFILPETKNKTLQEIEDHFNYGKFRKVIPENEEEVKMQMIDHDN